MTPKAKSPGEENAAEEGSIERFHRVLVESIATGAPTYLRTSFTVAEIYQSLVPYRTHRDRLGVAMNGDYEDVLLRLLAGEGGFLTIESEAARDRIRKELESRNPNTGIYREFAAAGVRLNPERLPKLAPVATEKASPAKSATEPNGRGAAVPAPTRPTSPPARREATSASATCPGCGAGLPDRPNLQFCPFCGTNIRVVPCRECGEVLDRAWRFCVACGTPSGG